MLRCKGLQNVLIRFVSQKRTCVLRHCIKTGQWALWARSRSYLIGWTLPHSTALSLKKATRTWRHKCRSALYRYIDLAARTLSYLPDSL